MARVATRTGSYQDCKIFTWPGKEWSHSQRWTRWSTLWPTKKQRKLMESIMVNLWLTNMSMENGSCGRCASYQWKFQGPPSTWDPHSHTTPIRIPGSMGIVWEASGKRVPLGVPGDISGKGRIFCCLLSFPGMFWNAATLAELVLKVNKF